MKKVMILALAILASNNWSVQAQDGKKECKVITIIESIVQGGVGRSRLIEEKEETLDAEGMAVKREKGNKNAKFDNKRKDLKIENIEETRLLNFYSGVGINFQNIASNDAIISSKITQMLQKGWDLKFVTSAVESDGGQTDGKLGGIGATDTGIAITRLYFFK